MRPRGIPYSKLIPVAVEKQKRVLRALSEAGVGGLTRPKLIAKTKLNVQAIDRTVRLVNQQGGKIEKREAPAGSGSRQALVLHQEPSWYREMSVPARLALRVAEAALPQVGSEALGGLLDQFEALDEAKLSPKDQARFESLLDRVDVRGTVTEPRKVGRTLLLDIFQALSTRSNPPEVEILYQRAGGAEPKPRMIIPYALTFDAFAGASYLLAWAQTSHGNRPLFFRLQRIRQWKATGKTGLLTPSERNLLARAQRYQIGAWFEDEEPFEIRVRVKAGTWLAAFEDSPPLLPGLQVDEPKHPDDQFRVIRFLASGLRGPARWVLQLGPEAEVLSPPEFRDHVAKLLEEMARTYRFEPKPGM